MRRVESTTSVKRMTDSAFGAIGSTAGNGAAHHSFAPFNTDVEKTISGTVNRFEWTNPHTWVWIDVTDEKGVVRQLEAADRLASLGTMAAGVAHEVNNPLLVVTANATLAVEALRELRGVVQSYSGAQLQDKLDNIEESVGDIHSAALRIGRVVSSAALQC